jgi:hypothetical protein
MTQHIAVGQTWRQLPTSTNGNTTHRVTIVETTKRWITIRPTGLKQSTAIQRETFLRLYTHTTGD